MAATTEDEIMERRFYYIEDMAAILGKSVAGIYGHLARKQYDAVPPPMKLGRRLAWLVEAVEDWVDMKLAQARAEVERQAEFIQAPARKRGRPTKIEAREKRILTETMDLGKTLYQSLKGADVKSE